MKGVYLVFFKAERTRSIEVGALGEIVFEPGVYVYTGSAMNSVEKRLERHFSSTEKKHWHIDYLSAKAEAIDHFILPESSEYECTLSRILEDIGEPVKGFGCSDCLCDSHLFHFDLSTSSVFNNGIRG